MKKILCLAILALMVSGCGSRKRAMEKKESKLEYAAENDTLAHTNVKNDIVEHTATDEKKASETQENGVDVGPGGKAVIEEFDTAGNLKKKTTIENNGRTKARQEKTSSDTQTTTKKTDKSETDIRAEGKSKVTLEVEDKGKAVAVDRKGGGVFWLWILIAVGAIVWIVVWIRRRNKEVL